MDLIKNIIEMYGQASATSLPPSDGGISPIKERKIMNNATHVEVLTASVRSLDHFLQAINLGSDIITSPMKVIKAWADAGMPTNKNYNPPVPTVPSGPAGGQMPNLKPIQYQKINLNKPWQEYNLRHELTDKGLEKFSQDWNMLIK